MFNIDKIFKKYNNLPVIAIWKAIIINEGINNYLNVKDFDKKFNGYKFKYAVKNPIAIDYKVIDCSSNQKVIPSEVIIKDISNNLSLLKLRYNPHSIISLSIKNNKERDIKFYINNNGKKVDIPVSISLVKKIGNSVINLLGTDRLAINLFDGCWSWNTGCQCKFCDLSPKRKTYNSVVPSLNDLSLFSFNYDLWWNKSKSNFFRELNSSFKKIYKLAKPHKHLLIMSGGFVDNNFLWKIIFELIVEINHNISLKNLDNYLNIPPPTKNIKKNFIKLKKLGIKQVQINLEVTGKRKFEFVCPGKDSSIGYDNYKKALMIAVDIFGRGHARSNFVFTSHSSRELLIEAKNLAKLGIVMDYSIFQPKRGTPWSEKISPSVSEILNFTENLAKIYKKNKFKGIYCNLSSRSSIINEILNNKN